MTVIIDGLDDLKSRVGQALGSTDWAPVSQEQIHAFAEATGDRQWIHVDVERARSGPFGGPIAHGFLTLSLLIPLWSQLVELRGVGMAVNYGLNKVRFPAPVPAKERITHDGRDRR